MTKGGHLTLVAGLLAGLGMFALPLTAMAQMYPGQASYYQNFNGGNGFNGLNNPGRHLGWQKRRWAMANGGGCHGNMNGLSANPYATQYANPYGLNQYTSYGPLAGNNVFANGMLGNSFQPLNNSSFLSLTPSQERAYMKNAKNQINQLLNNGQINSSDASMLKNQLKAAENYYYNNNGGSAQWRNQGANYNWNSPLASFAGSGGLFNGNTPYSNAGYGSTLDRLRNALGL